MSEAQSRIDGTYTAPRVKAPLAVRCRWERRARHSVGGAVLKDVHVCPDCESWTANLPLYRYMVCPKKERRTATRDRRAA